MSTKKSRFTEKYGPWALVTGGSDGIGRAIAFDAAARGLNVCLVARREDQLQATARDIEDHFGVETRISATDLSTPNGVDHLVGELLDLDIGLFAACAGFGTSGHFVDSDLTRELNMVDVNCRAVVALTHVIANAMAVRGGGGIVLMGSIVGFQGVANAAHYAATKAYIQCFAEGLNAEMKIHNVDVLASAPGPVMSGFAERADMTMGGAASPASVAKGTLNALGRKSTVRPGLLSKFLGYNLAILPRPLRKRVMGQIMKGMANQKDVAGTV
ncbi:MAG: SDR family NAD(P)-dependent oxidoreductase [Henriciella sp.]|nr:SDR family NAD(P)-dependent oxidoreductase [Henriciella sp.]